ncbi:MAG TPA: carboxypeptidase regulatory-like domain-containing protein [Planctomycetaceae bacterium]|nr:carboxypeptidase regulatory-like domain-containing protein [Planctomycetaceae bacterium]
MRLRLWYGRLVLAVVLAIGVCYVAGCSRGPERPKTYPVTGTVTLDGKPVEGATVVFVPKEEGTGRAATGVTDSNGKYSLGTFASGDGVIPGEYLIKITKYRPPSTQQPPVGDEEDEESEMRAFLEAQQGTQQTQTESELPVKYSNEQTSGLFFTVEAKDNTFDIALKR